MNGSMVKRSDKIAYMGVKGDDDSYSYHRMKGFSAFSISKNPKQYKRQYIDETFEQTDIAGYSPSVSYTFDQYLGNPVHSEIIRISDGELIGTDAIVPIILVDMTKDVLGGGKAAVKRDFTLVPDSEGSDLETYTYSGSLKVKSGKINGTAATADNWETITFTESD